nr:MAG TPA_asm: Protein of unknown function (DUF2799) [Bacteriophage sp.]
MSHRRIANETIKPRYSPGLFRFCDPVRAFEVGRTADTATPSARALNPIQVAQQ